MTRWTFPYPTRRQSLAAMAAAALLAVIGSLLASLGPVGAAAPMDRRSTGPNHSSEWPGTGYLLSDPSQGASGAYWAGAYRTLGGIKSYCIDDFYDYPNPTYGYRTREVSRWGARAGSNDGASGHRAQRIIWIVNSYGQSPNRGATAAVSMAINLLTGSAPFARSYRSYFARQLEAIDPGIVRSIDQMLVDSDRYAGPYSTRITFGAAPPVGGTGAFAVSIRSANGTALRNAPFVVTSVRGGRLLSPAVGRTDVSGVGHLSYTALRAGTVSAAAHGTSAPATTVRVGYSPSHGTMNFSTGSQRVVAVSAVRLRPVAGGTGHVTVLAPVVVTSVVGGVHARPVGVAVADRITASGLTRLTEYRLRASLIDFAGRVCATVSLAVRADAVGNLVTQTPPVATCGVGTNTFTETLTDSAGAIVAITPPGQPTETFPVMEAVTSTPATPPAPATKPKPKPTPTPTPTPSRAGLAQTGVVPLGAATVGSGAVGLGLALLAMGRRRYRARH